MMQHIEVKANILEENRYTYLFSVEEVNKRVLNGIPFREAYKEVGLEIEAGNFHPERQINHSHEGSIGQLNLDEIRENFNKNSLAFEFEKVKIAIKTLKLFDI
jgi:argininosuccinate lyase